MPEADAVAALEAYPEAFDAHMHASMTAKLGLTSPTEGDRPLWTDLLGVLAEGRPDYTTFFRRLGTYPADDGVRRLFADPAGFDAWAERYRDRLRAEASDATDRKRHMDAVNPKYILRNYLAQIAIDKANRRDFAEVDRLRGVLRMPFAEQPEMDHYAAPTPDLGEAVGRQLLVLTRGGSPRGVAPRYGISPLRG